MWDLGAQLLLQLHAFHSEFVIWFMVSTVTAPSQTYQFPLVLKVPINAA